MTDPVILSLGSVNVDFQVRVERQPEVGETLLAHDLIRLSGGKAANVCMLARKLEHPAVLLAQVGDDPLADWALGPLRDAGVDLSQVGRVEQAMPGISMIAVPPDGKKMIILAPNANGAWGEPDAVRVERAIGQAPARSVLVVDYEVPPFVVARAAASARERGFRVVLDPSPADRVDPEVLPSIDVVVPNPKEAEGVTGVRIDGVGTAREAGAWLLERGAGAACIKLADGGCVAVDKETAVHVRPLPVEVTDTTGAGDAFAGGLAVALLEARPLREAVCFATAASHVAVTGYGSAPAYPERRELLRLFEELRTQAVTLEPGS
ncbi:MAG: ribokinase [Geminicoccaceae bacterium]|nr:ribokinase [Geminicoccaceae bacterium]